MPGNLSEPNSSHPENSVLARGIKLLDINTAVDKGELQYLFICWHGQQRSGMWANRYQAQGLPGVRYLEGGLQALAADIMADKKMTGEAKNIVNTLANVHNIIILLDPGEKEVILRSFYAELQKAALQMGHRVYVATTHSPEPAIAQFQKQLQADS